MRRLVKLHGFSASPAQSMRESRSASFIQHGWLCLICGLIATSTLVAAEIPSVPASEAGLSDSKLAAVDQFMEQQVKDQKIAGGIVIISHNGKIGFFHTYGQMDVEAKKAMRPDTIFRLYSMTKAITNAAALNLYDAAKIGLDDPVSKYIPEFANSKVAVADDDKLRDPARPVTVRDLMLHTSGLTYGDGPDVLKAAYSKIKPLAADKLDEVCQRLGQVPLAHDPGADWTYGASTDVLGRIVEVASGESLDTFLQKAIFVPLEMTDTAFSVPA